MPISVKRKSETEVGADTADYCGNTLYGAGNSGDICTCFAYDSFSSTCSCMLCKKFTKILWLALKQQVVVMLFGFFIFSLGAAFHAVRLHLLTSLFSLP